MNGERGGDWTTLRTGARLFRHEASWIQPPRARTLWNRMQALVAEAPVAIERIGTPLPKPFPEWVYERIRAGVIGQSVRLANTAGIK
jgi:hypothetical protein